MNRVLFVCGSGMSSSIMAAGVMDYFLEKGKKWLIDYSDYRSALIEAAESEYDLYLIAPQIRMYLPLFKEKIDHEKIVTVSPEDFVPVFDVIEKLAGMLQDVLEKMKDKMKKVLIVCAGGMSSSMIAKKTTELLQKKGHDILVEACGTGEGHNRLKDKQYDLYLISPQTKMYYKQFEQEARDTDQALAQIPPQAYIPVPIGIEKMAKLVEENL